MKRTAPILAAAALTALMGTSSFAARATAPKPTDLTPKFRTAMVNVDRLSVFEVGGVVLIRGRAANAADAEAAGQYAKSLGYERVANLVQVSTPPDDAAIQRAAERELSLHRNLDGCKFRVNTEKGVVSVAGSVQHELQKDVAVAVLRNLDGVREVRSELGRD